MEEVIEDMYFDSYEEALIVAEKQNVFTTYKKLQICYYDGLEKKNKYKNLINLKRNNITNRLQNLNTRIPTKIISKNNLQILEELKKHKLQIKIKHQKILDEIKNIKLNFDEPLRFYISSDFGAKTVLNSAVIIEDTLNKMGFDVFHETNNELTVMDDYTRAKSILSFRPHCIISVNRLRNNQLNDDMFHFVWIIDAVLYLYDKSELYLRSRDYYFYHCFDIKKQLLKKGIEETNIFSQSFFLDANNFYLDSSIQRENKIVFIGNCNLFTDDIPIRYKDDKVLINNLMNMYLNDELTYDYILNLSEKLVDDNIIKSPEHLYIYIFHAIENIVRVKWLCSQTIIPVEVYGAGWENIKEVKQFYKGYAKKEDMNDIFNSAKYTFHVYTEYYYAQRVIDSAYCGCIPILHKAISNFEEFNHYNNVLLYTDEESLHKCLDKEPIESPNQIAEDIRCEFFIKRILTIVNSHLNKAN